MNARAQRSQFTYAIAISLILKTFGYLRRPIMDYYCKDLKDFKEYPMKAVCVSNPIFLD
jgi:hypothetical protein